MIVGDTIQYSGSNKDFTLTKGDIFSIIDIIDYDEMTSMVTIENISTKEVWGINYIDLHRNFIEITKKEQRNKKINNLIDNE